MTEIRDRETGLTLEQTLKKREEEINQVHKDHPEMTPPADDKWWVPSVTFPFHVKTTLSDDELRKLNKTLDKAFLSNFEPNVTKAAMEEAKASLAAHEGLAEQFEAMFLPVDEEKAEYFRNIIQPMKRTKIVNKQNSSPSQPDC